MWSDRIHRVLASFVFPVCLLAVWELAARSGWLNVLFVPAPTSVIKALGDLYKTGELCTNLSDTLWRLVLGFSLGASWGVCIALLMIGSIPLGRALQPLVSGVYAIPKVAFLPLFVLWLGVGETSKIATIALGAFFPVVVNVYVGSRSMDPLWIRAAVNLGASRRQVILKVVLPALLPDLYAGLKLGSGVALTLVAYAEMTGVASGIGYLTQIESQLFHPEAAYASLLVLVFIALASQALIAWIQAIHCKWEARQVSNLLQ